MAPRLASISVDLDSLKHYCRIHGLEDPGGGAGEVALALARLGELFARRRLPATLFAIGEDLADPEVRFAVSEAHQSGLEIASHSYSHDYALARRPQEEIDAELRRAEEAIVEVTGEAPVGFRAPGYTLSPTLLEVLCARGYLYDSSAFPAAPYYLAKAAVMGALRLTGRRSRAVLDRPRVLFAPREPYRPALAEPYRRGDSPIVELPMVISGLTRVPFIGTLAVTFPLPIVRALYLELRRAPFFNLELHAIDVLDAEDGVPPALARRQRDLAIPHAEKLARLHEIFGWLAEDYEVVLLRAAARRFFS